MMHIIFRTHTRQRYEQINSQVLVILPNEVHSKFTTSYLNPNNDSLSIALSTLEEYLYQTSTFLGEKRCGIIT
jgi:hypothetical protein